MIALIRYVRYAAVLLPLAAVAFLGWHYLALNRDAQAAAAEIQRLTVQVETAQQMAAATVEAANAEIARARRRSSTGSARRPSSCGRNSTGSGAHLMHVSISRSRKDC